MQLVAGSSRAEARPLVRMAAETFAPRLQVTMNAVVLVAVLLIQLVNVSQLSVTADGEPVGTGLRLACYLGIGALFALQLLHSSRRLRPRRPALLVATLAVQAAISYVPTLYVGVAWGGAAGFFLGSLLLLIQPAWLAFAAFGAFEVLTAYTAVADGQTWTNVVYAVVANGLTAMVIYSVSKMADLVSDLHEARHELADAAVEQERQRFSRDLHDLLGYSLSAITLKGELAHGVIDESPAEAKQQLEAIQRIARVALQDVRSVARSYRSIPLRAQLASARSVLTSGGIEGESVITATVLPGPCETVLATVVREGVTNVLRHSRAAICDIAVTQADDTIVLTVRNDGVDDELIARARAEGAGFAPGDGQGGLQNLAARLAQVDGSLVFGVDGAGCFVLTATVPVRLTPAAAATLGSDDPACRTREVHRVQSVVGAELGDR